MSKELVESLRAENAALFKRTQRLEGQVDDLLRRLHYSPLFEGGRDVDPDEPIIKFTNVEVRPQDSGSAVPVDDRRICRVPPLTIVPTADASSHGFDFPINSGVGAVTVKFRVRSKGLRYARIRLRIGSDNKSITVFDIDFQRGQLSCAKRHKFWTPLREHITRDRSGFRIPGGDDWYRVEIELEISTRAEWRFVWSLANPANSTDLTFAGNKKHRLDLRDFEVLLDRLGSVEDQITDDEPAPHPVGGKAVTPKKWAEIRGRRRVHEREFAASGELDRIEQFRNKHKGKRAFIIGNGPSLNRQHLDVLSREITFVSNWFIHHPRFEVIDPTYYAIASHEMFGGWNKVEPELNSDFSNILANRSKNQTFFISSKYLSYVKSTGVLPYDRTYGLIFDRPKFQIDERGTQNFDLARCMDDGYTALLTFCVPLCAFMGFREVFFVGCDSDYGIQNPGDQKSYFYSFDKHKSSTTSHEGLMRAWADNGPAFQSYRIAARESEKRGMKLFNATAGGRLEELPRVTFEELFYQ